MTSNIGGQDATCLICFKIFNMYPYSRSLSLSLSLQRHQINLNFESLFPLPSIVLDTYAMAFFVPII